MLIKADYRKAYDDYEKIMKRYDNNTKMVEFLCFGTLFKSFAIPREYFDDIFEYDFEFLKIPVSRNYEIRLKSIYGDNYMIPLKLSTFHKGIFFDTDKSYTEHFKGKKFCE